jgi:hypothetical protein
MAQLRAERDAIAAVAPDATRRLEALDLTRLDAPRDSAKASLPGTRPRLSSRRSGRAFGGNPGAG